MTDRSASVIALLKNVASERKIEYQTCLQYFCQEEFLRRLSKSKFSLSTKLSKIVCVG